LVPVIGPSVSHLAIPLLFLVSGFTPAEQLPIKAYTTAEGLAHNHINRIRQDVRGFLWFCTDSGLTRFDGHDFVSYTTRDGIPHPWVNDFLEARDGTYWVATDGGVVMFNPAGISACAPDRRRATSAPPMFVTVGPDGPAEARRVNALAEDKDGSILCATYSGLYRLQRAGGRLGFQAIEIGLPNEMWEGGLVNNLSPSRRGGWWIAARYGLCHHSSEGRWERFTSAQGLPDNFVETVYEDRSGRVWAGTRTGGFCAVRPAPAPGGRVVDRCYSVADGLPNNDVRSILQSADETFWIGTAGGLSAFHPGSHGPLFLNYSVTNGLSDSHILKLFEDSDANLWMGTASSGVMKMVRQGLASFDARHGFLSGTNQESIFETVVGETSIISEVGGRIVVQVLTAAKFRPVYPNLPLMRGGLNPKRSDSLQDRFGEWWIGTGHGLFRFPRTARVQDLAHIRPKAVYTAAHGFAGDNIDALYQDSHGDVWISTNSVSAHSISRWSRSSGTFQHYTETSPLLKQKRASAFGEDGSGNLWIGLVDDGGIIRYRQGRFEPVPAPQGAFRGIVRAIYVDRSGRIWAATSQAGLARIDGTDLDQPHVQRYSEAEGLSSNDVCCVTEDESGQIYAGTDSGVDRLDPVSGRIRWFTVADGLVRGAVLLAHRDRAGALWFVTNNGISRLIPARARAPSVPMALIRRLRIMGDPYPISEVGEAAVSGIVVPPQRNAIQVEFAAPDFRPGSPLQYQYKLESGRTEWSPASRERSVHYASLSPGDYQFLVRAVGPDGAGPPAAVSFRVLAPVWRRAWFLALVAVLGLTAAYFVHRYRVSQLIALEHVRTRIATDLHDDIGASLSQVAIMSEVVSRHAAPDRKALEEIAGTSRELLRSMSEIVWAIDPSHDRLHDLTQRMRWFAGEILSGCGIALHFSAPEQERELRLSVETRRQVFLIFKECVNNIARHAQARHAYVALKAEQAHLILEIEDDGCGFDAGPSAGHGLRNMAWRARLLNATFEMQGSPGKGTHVILRVPLAPRRRWRRLMTVSRINMR
jgi:ligand-binding sensor domain-containing protein/two-component sensor histidine kinase